jgi:hypothetical protein
VQRLQDTPAATQYEIFKVRSKKGSCIPELNPGPRTLLFAVRPQEKLNFLQISKSPLYGALKGKGSIAKI